MATAVCTESATVLFSSNTEEVMPLRKTLWDQLHIWERGTGKQRQTCKLESRFNLFQTKLNLLLWVFPKAWPLAFFFFFFHLGFASLLKCFV